MKRKLHESIRKVLLEHISYQDAVSIFKEYSGIDVKGMSEKELKPIYRNLVLKYHPDKNKNMDTTSILNKINASYEILTKGESVNHKSSFRRSTFRDEFEDLMSWANTDSYEQPNYEQPNYERSKHEQPSYANWNNSYRDLDSPSFLQKIKNYFKNFHLSKQDREIYNSFYEQLSREKRYWRDRENNEGGTKKFRDEYLKWTRETKEKEKRLKQYLNQRYGYY